MALSRRLRIGLTGAFVVLGLATTAGFVRVEQVYRAQHETTDRLEQEIHDRSIAVCEAAASNRSAILDTLLGLIAQAPNQAALEPAKRYIEDHLPALVCPDDKGPFVAPEPSTVVSAPPTTGA